MVSKSSTRQRKFSTLHVWGSTLQNVQLDLEFSTHHNSLVGNIQGALNCCFCFCFCFCFVLFFFFFLQKKKKKKKETRISLRLHSASTNLVLTEPVFKVTTRTPIVEAEKCCWNHFQRIQKQNHEPITSSSPDVPSLKDKLRDALPESFFAKAIKSCSEPDSLLGKNIQTHRSLPNRILTWLLGPSLDVVCLFLSAIRLD